MIPKTLTTLPWVLAAVLLTAATAHAQSKMPVPAEELDPRFRVYLVQPVEFYPDPNLAGKGTPQFDTEPIERAIEAYFRASSDRFVIVPEDELYNIFVQDGLKEVFKFDAEQERAKELVDDGTNAYKRADYQAAEAKLIESARLYEQLQTGLIFPTKLARVYETLALVYSEQIINREDRRDELSASMLGALEKVVRLDPSRSMVFPFYPDSIEQSFRKARRGIIRTRDTGLDDIDRARARLMAEGVGADILVWGYVVQEGASLRLVLQMMVRDLNEEVFLPPEKIELGADTDIQVERAVRLASRFAACIRPLPQPRPRPVDREKGHFYLDSSFAYSVFLKPDTTLFDNFGFSLAGHYMMTDNFALVARLNLLTSGSDFEGDLRSEFSSVRTFLGGSFAVRVWKLRPHVTFAMEASRMGEIRLTDDFFCKVDEGSPRCNRNNINVERPGLLIGINSQVGVSMQLYRDLFMLASGSFSFFVLPLEGSPVDFPLGFDVGLEYRF